MQHITLSLEGANRFLDFKMPPASAVKPPPAVQNPPGGFWGVGGGYWLGRLLGAVGGIMTPSPTDNVPNVMIDAAADMTQNEYIVGDWATPPSEPMYERPGFVTHEVVPDYDPEPGFLSVPDMPDAGPDIILDVPLPKPGETGMTAHRIIEPLRRFNRVVLDVKEGRLSVGNAGAFRSPPTVSARLRTTPFEWMPRNDRKGRSFYAVQGAMRLITATFGAATEFQDLIEVISWNSFDARGTPAILAVRQEAFGGRRLDKGQIGSAIAMNSRAYMAVMSGLASGRFTIDLGGALTDYGLMQANDMAIALRGRAVQATANAAGFSLPVGHETLMNMHRRHIRPDDEEETQNVSALFPWSNALADRLFWSRSRGFQLQP